MTHVLLELVGWPGGIMLGNLLSNVVWSAAFEWRLRVHHRRTRDSIGVAR